MKPARSVLIGGELGELHKMLDLAALRRVDEVALLLLDFGGGRDQKEEAIHPFESGPKGLWFREVALN